MSTGINKITGSEAAMQNQINNTHKQPAQVNPQAQAQKVDIKDVQKGSTGGYHKKSLTEEDIKRVINKINENVSKLNKDVKFTYSDTIKSLVVKVVDAKTGKVIREIPPQEVINLQKKLSEVVGIIFDSKEVEK
ncbi:flagellar protein FlaG [Hippea sp. KM1]|uniref:flagellar protein FlaG n=1 Tax=Hippea sp. KM1 TaxID=944481 RepID=UPI00046D7CF6|nr:flagellar protein FlaG [Hippea sp. KM1]